MNRNQTLDVYRAAIEKWGVDGQLDILCEEAAEVVVARSKVRRGKPDALMALAEEVADLLICADQIRVYLGEELVDRKIDEKLHRLRKRLQE